MFGRDDENIAEEYFGAVNQFYLGVNRLENDLADKLAQLRENNPTQTSADDFDNDALAAIKGVTEGKRKLRDALNAQRKRWGW